MACVFEPEPIAWHCTFNVNLVLPVSGYATVNEDRIAYVM